MDVYLEVKKSMESFSYYWCDRDESAFQPLISKIPDVYNIFPDAQKAVHFRDMNEYFGINTNSWELRKIEHIDLYINEFENKRFPKKATCNLDYYKHYRELAEKDKKAGTFPCDFYKNKYEEYMVSMV